MNAWFHSHLQACLRALARMRVQPLATALSIAVIGVALALPLGFYVLLNNASTAAGRLNAEPNVGVFLTPAASDADAKAIEQKLRALPNAANVRFIDRATALSDLKRTAGMADLLAGMEGNPLPHAFSITPKSFAAEDLAALKKEISAYPKVEAVSAEFEWARKLSRFARFAGNLVLLLALALCIAVVSVIGNTIRLQMLTQKEEIVVARLIGASKRFVCRPFLYYGALQGVLAGLLAVALVLGLTAWVGNEVNALAESYGAHFDLLTLSPVQAAAVATTGAVLGWIGAFVSVALFLREH
ncbi:MAG: ABC transporter permease [Betaproteobacteria bacterium]|nr:ABC transporter permease [Betaproteobacteria bacterium]